MNDGQSTDRLSREDVRRAPKVLLHDHLDGGLRPQTIIELAARAAATSCPADDAESLGRWFAESADSRLAGALPRDVRPHRRR